MGRRVGTLLAILFGLASFAAAQNLTLDWAKTWDGSAHGDDFSYAVKVDPSGNIFVLGLTTLSGTENRYVLLKYLPDGTLKFVRLIGNPGIIQPSVTSPSLALDTSGNVYLTCTTWSSSSGNEFLTEKFDNVGHLLYARFFNVKPFTNGNDGPCAIAVDKDGSAVVVGSGYAKPVFKGVAIKYGPTGDVIWVSEPAFGLSNVLRGVAIDPAGDVYAVGDSVATISTYLIQAYKFDGKTGAIVWNVANGADSHALGRSVGIDPQGHAVFLGQKHRSDGGDSLFCFRRNVADGSIFPAGFFDYPDDGTINFGPNQSLFATAMAIGPDGTAWCTGGGTIGGNNCVAVTSNPPGGGMLNGEGDSSISNSLDAVGGGVVADKHGAGFYACTLGQDQGTGNFDCIRVFRRRNGTGDGNFTWTHSPGSSDAGTGIDIDSNEDLVVCGDTNGANLHDIVLMKLTQTPFALFDNYDAFKGKTLSIPAPLGVKANDIGSEQGSVVQASSTTHGALTLYDDGSFTYLPNTGFVGTDQFTYYVKKGSLQSDPATVTIYVHPAIVSLVVTNSTVGGEMPPLNGTVTLSNPETNQEYPGTFSSSAPALMVFPDHWYVSSGSKTGTFQFGTQSVSTITAVTIKVYMGPSSASAICYLLQGGLGSFSLSPSKIVGGGAGTATVSLTTQAPVGGTTVNLTGDPLLAFGGKTCLVPAGSMSVSFGFTTAAVASPTLVKVSASRGYVTRTVTETIEPPPTLTGLALQSATCYGGQNVTGTVTLDGIAAQGGTMVTLADDQLRIITPTSVTVPAGKTSASFVIQTTGVLGPLGGTITASLNGVSFSAKLTLYHAPAFESLQVVSPVTGGTDTTGTITVSPTATYGTLKFTVYSNDSVVTMTRYQTLAKGTSSLVFAIHTAKVAAKHTVTVTATITGVTKTATLVVNP